LQVNQNRPLNARDVGDDRVGEISQFTFDNIGDNVRWDCDHNQRRFFSLDRGVSGSVLRREYNRGGRRINERDVDSVAAKH